jgi:hypothetical protein
MVSTERNGDQRPPRDIQTAAVTARVKERADSVHREHEAIVVAIEQRDADAEFGWCPILVEKLGGRAELLAL